MHRLVNASDALIVAKCAAKGSEADKKVYTDFCRDRLANQDSWRDQLGEGGAPRLLLHGKGIQEALERAAQHLNMPLHNTRLQMTLRHVACIMLKV